MNARRECSTKTTINLCQKRGHPHTFKPLHHETMGNNFFRNYSQNGKNAYAYDFSASVPAWPRVLKQLLGNTLVSRCGVISCTDEITLTLPRNLQSFIAGREPFWLLTQGQSWSEVQSLCHLSLATSQLYLVISLVSL